MDKKLIIQVNGKPYPVKYGYGAIRMLGESWNLSGLTEVYLHVLKILAVTDKDPEKVDLDTVNEEDLGKSILQFENLEIIKEVAFVGVQYASKGEDLEVDSDDVMDSLLADMSLLSEVFQAFIKSMPQGKEDKKPNSGTAKKQDPATAKKKTSRNRKS